MKVIIDRFEGDFAIVETEDKKFVSLPKLLAPVGASEGAVISIELDLEETKQRRARVGKLMDEVWKE